MKATWMGCLLLLLASTMALGQTNPVPFVNQPLVPMNAAPGGSDFTLTVNGAGFVSSSVVNWNGTALTTVFVSSSQLTATVPASNIAATGTASITVSSPAPGGGRSNVEFFQVSSPVSQLTFANFQQNISTDIFQPTAADFNGDGKLDLAALSGYTGQILILLGNGDGTFEAPVGYGLGGGNIVSADFNGDGRVDLAVPWSGTNSIVAILLGNGDGTFQPQATFSTPPFPVFIGGGAPGSVSVLLGNGDGTLESHIDYAQGASPVSLAVGDFNGDGKLDIAYLDFGGEVSILLGNGDGTFQTGQSIATIQSGGDLLTADLNGDGKLDLVQVTGNSPVGNISVLLGNGDGTFQAPVNYSVPAYPEAVIAADFNGDGELDLATIDGAGASNVTTAVLSILLGNGDGTFQSYTDFPTNGGLAGLVAGDFNGDGKMDVAVTPGAVLLQGLFPAASVSSFSLTFGAQAVGTTSPAQTVTLTNTGTATLDLSNITITGTGAGAFAQTNTCGSTIAVNANCQVSVMFGPTSGGSPTASLNITDNALGSPQYISLAGATLTYLSPSSTTFPSQYVGTSGLPQTVTLTNTGTGTLTITSVAASPSDFAPLSTCGNSVGPGSSCSIGVFFDPTTTGTRNGTLTVTDSASDSPQTASLTGVGQDFSLAPSGSSTATVSTGQAANYTVTVAPGGGFNQTVLLSCGGAPALSTCSLPASVGLNGSATAVSVTVTTAGSSAGLTQPRSGPAIGGTFGVWVTLSGTLGLAMLVSLGSWRRARCPQWTYGLALLSLLFVGATLSACGGSNGSGGGSGGTQAGTYNLTVTGSFTSGSTTLTHNTTLTLTVQ